MSSPKPPPSSARASSARTRPDLKRPSSANPKNRVTGTTNKDRKSDILVDDNNNSLLTLQREDLISTIIMMKKEQRFLEMQMSQLKAENQRVETENTKQQRRIEKVMGSQQLGGQSANDVRKEIEKSVLVRQLKSQVS